MFNTKNFLVFSIFVMLFAFSCNGGGQSPVSVLPEWAESAIYMDINRVLNSPMIEKAAKEDAKYQDMVKLFSEAGIDPKKDVKSIVIGLGKIDISSMAPPKYYVNIDVNYDEAKVVKNIMDKAKAEGGQVSQKKVDGLTVINVVKKESVDVVFSNNNKITIVPSDSVNDAVALIKGTGKNASSNKSLVNAVDNINSNNVLWGAITLTDEMKAMVESQTKGQPMVANLSKQINGLNSILFGVNTSGSSTHINIATLSNDEKSSKIISQEVQKLYDGAKAMVGMFKAQLSQGNPDSNEGKYIDEILASVKIENKGNVASIGLAITDEQIEGLSKLKETMK